MEQQLYQTVLYLAGGVNLLLAFVLLYNNYWFRNYDVYRRARNIVAVNYAIFGVGMLLHAFLQWRTSWPAAATTLTLSYFHSGAVLFGWSHTSLMRPNYLTRSVILRDLIILAIGLAAYWTTAMTAVGGVSFLIFFAHAVFIVFTFYRTYYLVRRNIANRPAGQEAPAWWTTEAKRTVLASHHSFVIGCHLIVLFGLGSIALTAAFPRDIWPYTLLTATGIGVFCYIFYALTEYGRIIEAGTCATEDAAGL